MAATGLAGFVLAAIALHLLRPDLDPVHSQMSLYLIGAWGWLLQAAYVLLSLAMCVLAWGLYRALPPTARSIAPLLMFVPAGPALSTTPSSWVEPPGASHSLGGLVRSEETTSERPAQLTNS